MEAFSDVVWGDILGYLRTHYPSLARGWFGQLQPLRLESGELRIKAANHAQWSYLVEHCLRPFIEASQAATGRLVTVRFEHDEAGAEAAGALPPAEPASFEREDALCRLSADYRFENFVVGPCNQLAHASCLAVSENPGRVYNPLFIHGSTGLGKTHLLQGVCHRVLDEAPATRLLYLSCETFVNHFIEAVERGALHSFRYRYRHVDLLVIDDIQFLAEGERTQEEFFHTFNTLYQVQRQIILSADSPPSEIPKLEERLVSRFNWGLVTRIDPPSVETRLAIIRKKARMRGIELPEDAAGLIAARVKTNGRELEGALTRIQAAASVGTGEIDLALARRVLGDEGLIRRQVRIQDIMGLVTDRFGVKLSDMQGRRRTKSIALPRQVCMYLARQFTQHSLEEIGGFFGGRDHTTVLHANKLVTRLRSEDVSFRSQLDEIERALQQAD